MQAFEEDDVFMRHIQQACQGITENQIRYIDFEVRRQMSINENSWRADYGPQVRDVISKLQAIGFDYEATVITDALTQLEHLRERAKNNS